MDARDPVAEAFPPTGGLVVVSAWMEGGGPGDLRVRLTVVDDAATRQRHTLAVTDPDAAARIVRDWLDDLRRRPARDGGVTQQ